MKYCPNCKLYYDDSVNACGQCGGQLIPIPQQPMQAAPVDPADHTAEFDPADISENKVLAMAPYLLSAIGIIIALIASSSSPYTAFHVKQAMKLLIVGNLVMIVGAIIPVLGWIAMGICMIILLVLQIIAFIQVCKGQAKEPAIIKNLKFLK